VVQKEMAWRNMKYLDAVNNWAEIFDEVMPKNEETIKDMTDKIVNILTGTMLSESSKKKVLTEVRKKISKHSVDYSNLVVI
jgi:gamma-glutamyl:cysteine ligase YbdK (ATP-grasp superfamily)